MGKLGLLILAGALVACSSSDGGDASVDLAAEASSDASPDLVDDSTADLGGDAALPPPCAPYVVDPASVTTVAELLEAVRQIACNQAVRCGDTFLANFCDPELAPPTAGDPLVIDLDAAQRCLRADLAFDCANVGHVADMQACNVALLSAAARSVGASCASYADCDTGLCAGGGFGACGVCAAPRGAGESCFLDTACAAGLYCVDGFVCGVASGAGERCDSTASCEGGLVCDSTCVPIPGEGEPCAFSPPDCRPDLDCEPDSTGMIYTCVRASGPGELCLLGAVDCATGLRCTSDDYTTPGICVPRARPGCGCTADADCVVGACRGGVCVTRPRPGDACDGSDALRCVHSSCVAGTCSGPTLGASCDLAADCADGERCVNQVDGGYLCEPTAAIGAPCMPGQCELGVVCSATTHTCTSCRDSPDAGVPDGG